MRSCLMPGNEMSMTSPEGTEPKGKQRRWQRQKTFGGGTMHSQDSQEIDGKSLLLMTRNDVLTGLQLKLGPALKIYEYHVKPLQTKHLKNNSS
uniref:Isoform 3 of Sterile alpha motif domain-containing protein 13 n=1 Tax=Homo sapiens TaxID=9606 RepID=Q5VXD3-3|nr:HSD-42 [Homo sapiens]